MFILFTQRTGTPAQATVTDCQRRGRSTVCTGTWTTGGDLTDGGRVVRGTIEGISSDALGDTVDVRLSGDRAYTTSLRLPLVLIGCGVAIALLAGFQLGAARRRAPRRSDRV